MKYYLHSVDTMDDEKVIELFRRFGYEGTGLFHAILEKLAKQEKPIKTDVLKYQLKVGKKLEKCWKFMESLDIISSNNGDTFNKQLLNYAERYQIKKEKTAKKVLEWRKNQEDKENVTHYKNICNDAKVNKSKLNKNKINVLNNAMEKSIAIYPQFISVYNDFILKINNVPAKINSVQGKNAKEIISYLKTACQKKNPESGDAEIINSWKWILYNYDKWDSFHKGQLELRQINSNLINIINSCKNGTNNRKQPATSFAEIDRAVDIAFGNIPVSESTIGDS